MQPALAYTQGQADMNVTHRTTDPHAPPRETRTGRLSTARMGEEPAAAGDAPDLEALEAADVLAYAVERFHPLIALACSFQKEESVLVHMLSTIAPDARIVTLDTGVLFAETMATWRAFEERFGVTIEAVDVLPLPGQGPWTAERCCVSRKVEGLRAMLSGLDAWITGIRREQSPARADARKLEWDARNGLWKVNPIADWTDRDVWRYIAAHDVPHNDLHHRGYVSIGCEPCTQPGSNREGRWSGRDRTECGLHADH